MMENDRNRGLNPQDEGRNSDVNPEKSYDKSPKEDDANTGLPGRRAGSEGESNNKPKTKTEEKQLRGDGA